jgi:ABC-type branched-subunit amino acid transport system substrate-binding protein
VVEVADVASSTALAADAAAGFIAAGIPFLLGPSTSVLTQPVAAVTEAASTPVAPKILLSGSASAWVSTMAYAESGGEGGKYRSVRGSAPHNLAA